MDDIIDRLYKIAHGARLTMVEEATIIDGIKEIKRLRASAVGAKVGAEIERLKLTISEWRDLHAEQAERAQKAEDEAKRLRAALTEAKEAIQFWGTYAGDYSREKHGLAGNIAAIDAALSVGANVGAEDAPVWSLDGYDMMGPVGGFFLQHRNLVDRLFYPSKWRPDPPSELVAILERLNAVGADVGAGETLPENSANTSNV